MYEKSKLLSGITLFGILLVFTLTLAALTGCGTIPPDHSAPPNTSETTSDNNVNAEKVYNPNVVKKDFKEYIPLLGLTREALIGTLNEEPASIDEGGLEFKKAGIRVWFDPDSYTKVEQIFTMREDIDFNGAKVGDTIGKFRMAFGEPLSDRNGDAHFKYNDIFLSVNYDTATEKTVAVYILKNDF